METNYTRGELRFAGGYNFNGDYVSYEIFFYPVLLVYVRENSINGLFVTSRKSNQLNSLITN